MPGLIALDTEATGVDHYHSTRVFAVTICKEEGEQLFWEWAVDPYTRIPSIPVEDIEEIRAEIDAADRIAGQNLKFDIVALSRIGVYPTDLFPWSKVEDTLIGGHLLYSSRKHDLNTMVSQYLDEDISPFEDKLHEAVEECRRLCRNTKWQEVYGIWNIAERGPNLPSLKEKVWYADLWLPLAVATECEYPPNHYFWTVLQEYANADSEHTLLLWKKMEAMIRRRNLWAIYRARMDAIPVAVEMEGYGITASGTRADEKYTEFQQERKSLVHKCRVIAHKSGYDLTMPSSGNNDSLLGFVFDHLKLPVVKRGKEKPSLDKEVVEEYLNGTNYPLPEGSTGREFIEVLGQKRKLDTAISYLDGYRRFWLPLDEQGGEWIETGKVDRHGRRLWYKLHPSLNPTGTVQLRWSSSNPNEQNISKQEGYNLRYIFGPTPDQEWWSLDAQNIELRIPAFEAGEETLMNVFLRPKDPPYYGSYHLVVFDLLHPEKFAEHGKDCKDVFDSTWYQWVKNGNFAFIYGAQRKKADATYHVKGAYDMVRDRFPKIAKLSDKQYEFARRMGYVETIPDKTVDPARGFPIMASRTDDGGVMPTTPLNYHVSGTACWWTQKGMVRCHRQLVDWKQRRVVVARIIMQVHDEMVFSFPKSRVDPQYDLDREKRAGGYFFDKMGQIELREYKSNLGRVRVLQKLMEKGGDDISIPTPVGVEYNRDNWAEITLKC